MLPFVHQYISGIGLLDRNGSFLRLLPPKGRHGLQNFPKQLLIIGNHRLQAPFLCRKQIFNPKVGVLPAQIGLKGLLKVKGIVHILRLYPKGIPFPVIYGQAGIRTTLQQFFIYFLHRFPRTINTVHPCSVAEPIFIIFRKAQIGYCKEEERC